MTASSRQRTRSVRKSGTIGARMPLPAGSPASCARTPSRRTPRTCRMTELTRFGRILRQVVEQTPGVSGAVFTDWEGEPVDQYARGPTIEIQIGGAQWGLVLGEIQAALSRLGTGSVRSIHIACERAQVFIRSITSEYFVMLHASPEAHLGKTIENLERACDELEA